MQPLRDRVPLKVPGHCPRHGQVQLREAIIVANGFSFIRNVARKYCECELFKCLRQSRSDMSAAQMASLAVISQHNRVGTIPPPSPPNSPGGASLGGPLGTAVRPPL